MKDTDCVAFLRAALPRLGLRWPGFRKVRGTVCKRLGRRLRALGLEDLEAYNALLEADPEEWRRLDALCRIPISRFYRDRKVFEALAEVILPELAERAVGRASPQIRCWSAGCASGEEAYSLALAWEIGVAGHFPQARLAVMGTDVDPVMVRRAEEACYGGGTLKDLPPAWLDGAFRRRDGLFCLRRRFRSAVRFAVQDLRRERPAEKFDLILCRNLAFTYFEAGLQQTVLSRLAKCLEPNGYLVIGAHENLPPGPQGFRRAVDSLPIFVRAEAESRA
ncbi:MAG: protein-glutamate O-methyltransferase CheR [Kiloniellales bacterium]|nr:protein-glutamate O-methyltransferase CheR [Kiloniellales bacterium]